MKRNMVITGITLAILMIVGNYLASRHFFRIDLTENREFTLSESTKTILRNLKDVVTMRVYFSTNLPPQLTPMQRGIEDLLAEYRQYAGENFQVEYHDPQADPQTERELMMLGIQPMQLNVVERDKQEVARIFLGLVLFHNDRKEVIPVNPREPTRHLEEWMTGAVVKLTREKPPTIGWWAAETRAEGEGFTLVRQLLAQRYTITEVPLTTEALSPAKLEAAVLFAPKTLTPEQLAAIDQYLDQGGSVLMLVGSVELGGNAAAVKRETGLEPLLAAYGLEVPARLVADAVSDYATFRSGYFNYTVPYPLWPAVRGAGLHPENPVVSQLESLTLPWVSPIYVKDPLPQGLQATVLAKSSPKSAETPGEPPFALDPEAAGLLVPRSEATPRNLIVSLHGVFPDPYGDALPRPKQVPATRAGKEGTVIVVGTAAFLEDRFAGQGQFQDGLTFFENVVDHFTVGDELLGIRSRPVSRRPLAQLTAGEMGAIRYAHMLGIPLLVISGGLGGLVARRRRWQRLRSLFAPSSR